MDEVLDEKQGELEEKPKRRKQVKKRARQQRSTGPVIYTGPNLRGLAQYTVFREELPGSVMRMMEKQPEIERLIVPIGQIGATAERIKQTGTMEHKAYHQLRKDVK